MKEVKVRTRYDYRAFKYCNWYMLKYNRKVYIVYAVLCAFSLLAAVGMIFLQPGNYLFPIVFAILGVYAIYQVFTLEKKLDANIARHFNSHEPFEQIIAFSDEKIVVYPTDTDESFDYDWAFVSEIHRINEFYFLRLGTSYIMVDRSADCLVEGTAADLDAIMDEKGLAKPYKKFDGVVVTKPITFVQTYVAPVTAQEAEVVEEKEALEAPQEENNEEDNE